MSDAGDPHAPLVRMANQIAANLAVQGESVAARETAEHIVRFWEPRMRAALLTVDPARLTPIAQAALAALQGMAAAPRAGT